MGGVPKEKRPGIAISLLFRGKPGHPPLRFRAVSFFGEEGAAEYWGRDSDRRKISKESRRFGCAPNPNPWAV